MTELPRDGEVVPAEKFVISPLNIRYDVNFGDNYEDKLFLEHFTRRLGQKLVSPFVVRAVADRFEVLVGRRRFLAKKAVGTKNFVKGVDFVIHKFANDQEAMEASLIENLTLFRKSMNPMIRATGLNTIIAHSPGGLRATARRLGIPRSTLSEWLQVLKLSPKLQDALRKNLLTFQTALKVVKLRLGAALQDELADILETDGLDAFQKEVARLQKGTGKRGIPKGVYEIARVTWDTRSKTDIRFYETLSHTAERQGLTVPEYIKAFLLRRVDEITTEGRSPSKL